MSKPLVKLFDAGAFECQVDDCGGPWVTFHWEPGRYADGSDVLYLEFDCQWGHTTTVSLSERKGQTLYSVKTETDPEWAS